MKRRTDPFSRPLDQVLLKLRELWPDQTYQANPDKLNVWFSRCPFCRTEPVFTLEITEEGNEDGDRPGGQVSFTCLRGCDERLIRLAFGLDVLLPRRRAA
jgi:hypothetical protein